MASDLMAAVLTLLDREPADGHGASASPVAAFAAATILGVDGLCAGVGTGPGGTVLAWGHETSCNGLEDLQFTLGQGQGPGLAATATGAPVLVPDLAEAEAGRAGPGSSRPPPTWGCGRCSRSCCGSGRSASGRCWPTGEPPAPWSTAS